MNLKIKKTWVNNQKKCLEVETAKGIFSLPFGKLSLIPTKNNSIDKIYVDQELGNRGITYVLKGGEEDSLHLDAFLDYNQEPEYMRKIHLHNLTIKCLEAVKKSKLSKREIARKLRTSPAHLYRLLDTANYGKTMDQMVKLLTCLGIEVEIRTRAA